MKLRLALAPAALLTASAAAAQQGPAVRPLGATVAAAADTIGAVAAVRALSDGRVLVNDPLQRRVLLLDQGLRLVRVVADSLNAEATYGARPVGLIPFRGDSTLFVDAMSMSMLVLDPQGKVGRVMAVPRSQDAGALTSAAFGGVGFDPAGRLVYRALPSFEMRRGPGGPGGAGGPGGPGFNFPSPPDTAALVRVDLATRKVDTLTWIKVPQPKIDIQRDADGRVTGISTVLNPLPQTDDWAMLPDGTVAAVRGRDYHVDWIAPDGTRSSSAKVPFAWQRMSDEQKVAFLDSVKTAREKMGANAPQTAAGAAAAGAAQQFVMRGPGGGAPGGEGGGVRIMIAGGPGGEGGPPRREGRGGPGGPMSFTPQMSLVAPSDLPDYKPPFLANSTRADLDGNLWVRIQGGYVYDVINRKGELVDRVRVPGGRQVVGFGPGTVFLASRESNVTRLEVAKIR